MNKAFFGYGIALPAILIAVDQYTKYSVTRAFDVPMHVCRDNPTISLTREFTPLFDLTLLCNQGISFGFLGGGADLTRWALTAFAILMSVVLFFMLSRTYDMLSRLGISFIIGGALGNVIDRALFGAVTDFVDVTDWLPIFPWIFNVADSAISCGVVALLVGGFFTSEKNVDPSKST